MSGSKTSWAAVIHQVQGDKPEARAALDSPPSAADIDRLIDALAAESPIRAQLFRSPEFREAAEGIWSHEGRAEALAALCNALVIDLSEEVTRKELFWRKAKEDLPRVVDLLNKADKALSDLSEQVDPRDYRELLRSSRGFLIPSVIRNLADDVERIARRLAEHDPKLLGLDAKEVGEKRGVTLASALPAEISRQVWRALPDDLKSKHALIARLITKAGVPTDRQAVKSAIQARRK